MTALDLADSTGQSQEAGLSKWVELILIAVVLLIAKFTLPVEVPGARPARQLVNFHLLFNVALVILWLPLVVPLATLTKRLMPDREAAAAAVQARSTSSA